MRSYDRLLKLNICWSTYTRLQSDCAAHTCAALQLEADDVAALVALQPWDQLASAMCMQQTKRSKLLTTQKQQPPAHALHCCLIPAMQLLAHALCI